MSGLSWHSAPRPCEAHTEAEAETEAGRETGGKKQELSDAKAWIQNSLITVVGFGVLAYLQTLEASA